jgi:hypothetical protein
LCKICGKRRAKRNCPAVHGDICTLCCGTEREVSLSCPLDCVYLQEGHKHEKAVPMEPQQISYSNVRVTEEFLREHEDFLLFCVYSLLQAAMRTPGAVDTDVLAALDAAIRTQQTLESGLVYETRAENQIAEGVRRLLSASMNDYGKLRSEKGLPVLRDSEIFNTLVFLHRLGQQSLTGRPRGRMYLDLLRQMVPDGGVRVQEHAPSIIL